MGEREQLDSDLRATAESIAADAERLQAIEQEKGTLDPGDPRVDVLSAEAERIAKGLVPKTTAQSELAREAGTSS